MVKIFEKIRRYFAQKRCYGSFWIRCNDKCGAYSEIKVQYGFKNEQDVIVTGHCMDLASKSVIGHALRLLNDRTVRSLLSK